MINLIILTYVLWLDHAAMILNAMEWTWNEILSYFRILPLERNCLYANGHKGRLTYIVAILLQPFIFLDELLIPRYLRHHCSKGLQHITHITSHLAPTSALLHDEVLRLHSPSPERLLSPYTSLAVLIVPLLLPYLFIIFSFKSPPIRQLDFSFSCQLIQWHFKKLKNK